MKKNIFLAVFCLVLSAISFAQVPQKMSYQAVVRGSDNNLVTNQQVAMRVSILQGSTDGTAVYTETHSAQTNANGLVSIEIGDGTSNDDFTAINWANGPFFVMTETDVNGGDDYDIVGVSQLLSVPYAMYAQTAGNMPDVSGFLTEEGDPTVPDWAKAETKPSYSYEEITGKPTNVSAFTNDANYLTSYTETDPTVPAWAKAETKPTYTYEEIENTPDLFDGNYNSLTNRPELFSGSYEDLTNKPELFDGNYNNLTNTPDLSGYLTSYTESQTLADAAALGNSVNTQLKNVTDPTDAQDAATKKYIDDIVAPILAQNARMQATVDSLNYVLSLNVHGYVDLGLPSGTKWATCNVGANSPEEYGDYFAWDETAPKDTYSWSTYSYYDGSSVTKYTGSDNLTTLEASDDAATANWGSAWRMPTKEEFDELKNNCTVTWTTQNGVNGSLFTGPNGNSIFLPAAGYRYDSELYGAGSFGYSWSSSLNTDYPSLAWSLGFNSGGYYMYRDDRYCGQSVRPVCVSQN